MKRINDADANRWLEANQRLLVAEVARVAQRLRVEPDPGATSAALAAARDAMPGVTAIDYLSERFGLSPFERDVLLLCAGVEMDAELGAVVAAARGDARRGGPSFGLALATLEDPHWSALTPVGPLRRWRLVEVDESAGLTQGRLRIDERILHFLAGVNYPDGRLRGLLRPAEPPSVMAKEHRAVCQELRGALEATPGDEAPLVLLTGDDPLGQADVAATAATELGLSLQTLRAGDVPAGYVEVDALATLCEREALLLDCALLLSCDDDGLPAPASRLVEQLGCPLFVSVPQPPSLARSALRFVVDRPGPLEQKRLWQGALGAGAARLNGALDGVASQFKLSTRVIQAEGARLATALAAGGSPALLWQACRAMGRSRLDELAQHVEVAASWEDLVLPAAQKATLRRLGGHVRNRLKVQLEWGFAAKSSRGLGISALFAGESGTGKTMAAEILARELDLDLYRIDLSAVVSKYVGETEKNLRRVFDAADESGAVLLFDEADALFGKRSEVKDSHDRYANIEVSYLLQRMDAYRGLAILTTNAKAALDVAFERRLRFVVHFPFPDQAMREAIWRHSFPAPAPLGALDYAKLSQLSVPGGGIRNIALNAAFAAAELGEPIAMGHLLAAARHEASKRERPLSEAETRGWE